MLTEQRKRRILQKKTAGVHPSLQQKANYTASLVNSGQIGGTKPGEYVGGFHMPHAQMSMPATQSTDIGKNVIPFSSIGPDGKKEHTQIVPQQLKGNPLNLVIPPDRQMTIGGATGLLAQGKKPMQKVGFRALMPLVQNISKSFKAAPAVTKRWAGSINNMYSRGANTRAGRLATAFGLPLAAGGLYMAGRDSSAQNAGPIRSPRRTRAVEQRRSRENAFKGAPHIPLSYMSNPSPEAVKSEKAILDAERRLFNSITQGNR